MKREKNDKYPRWRKTSPGTLVLRKPLLIRLKPKQEICCPVKELGIFAISDFELIDEGKGEFQVTKKSIKESVEAAEKGRIRGSGIKPTHRLSTKLKDVEPTVEEVKKVKAESGKSDGDEEYFATHKGSGKWIVCSSSGKQMHENYLDKVEAKKLVKTLKG